MSHNPDAEYLEALNDRIAEVMDIYEERKGRDLFALRYIRGDGQLCYSHIPAQVAFSNFMAGYQLGLGEIK
ncbi:MAG: hypothetical protein KJN67_05045 [Pontiella sp.]|nr:hypothetical protein [Pontiella sp.]